MEKFYFTKQIYDKDALLKAAYRFTDNAYIHIDVEQDKYVVSIEAKNDTFILDEKEFQNEILAQMVRKRISEQTRNIRELIMARAFSSTIIYNDGNNELEEHKFPDDIDENDILTDWFDRYE